MGSPAAEEHRRDNEGPQREVRLARPFAIGRYTITRGQFASFVAATKHGLSGGAYAWTGQDWKLMADGDWRNPGFAQTDAHPVVCVSWLDAQAYVHWLAQRTGQPYRLPTEAEWEYAARAGTATPFWTGATLTTARASFNGNYAYGAREGIFSQGTVPVDEPSVPANPFGLHHVHGNVFEWVQDSYAASYQGAPINGHVSVDRKNGRERVLRGGSWIIYPRNLRSVLRDGDAPGDRVNDLGFRVARTLTP
jgi:formylglycine-generating enzyme required for sulfatase activity